MTLGACRKRGAQPIRIIVEIVTEFALVESRFQLGMNELDRIFQGDDVDGLGLVDLVENGRESGGLATAGGACDQNKAGLLLGYFLENRRQVERLNGRHLCFEDAQDDGKISLLPEDTDTEARFLVQGITAVAGSAR